MSKMIRIRATAEDEKMLDRLSKKLGLNMSALVRLALRKLYESEVKK